MKLHDTMATPPVKRARALRKAMTPPEIVLWQHLRALKSNGWHFRRQAPEGRYMLDFICRRARLVIEVDGVQHANHEQAERDATRDTYLAAKGFQVLRFWASDVMNEPEGVVSTILAALGATDMPANQRPPLKITGRYGQLVRLGLRPRPSN